MKKKEKQIKQIKENYPIAVKATFLGAHAVPKDYSQTKYVSIIINEMIPETSYTPPMNERNQT